MSEQHGEQGLREPTKVLALDVVRFYSHLPQATVAQVLGRQVLRSGTSVGAQYREAVRARSIAEFASKLESALQELEETMYWLELLAESGIVPDAQVAGLLREADELTAMLVASAKTARSREHR